MSRSLIVILFILAIPAAANAGKLKVVASFSILGDMVHEVGGDAITLTTLVGPNSDTHVYEPTPNDAKTIAAADLVIINGLGFEGWMTRLIESSGYKKQVAIATTGITPLTLTEAEAGKTLDPHAWQDLANGRIYVINIQNALTKADPSHAALYQANAQHYIQQITKLDAWVKSQIATVPLAKRRVITSHDAFQYFARAYGVEFIAPLGISTESEASASDIAHLIDQIRMQKVYAVFMENIGDPRLIHQLEQDAGAYASGTLYSDALSKPDSPAGTYLSLFRYNVTQLIRGMLHQPF